MAGRLKKDKEIVLIKELKRRFKTGIAALKVGIGDDAAVVRPQRGGYQLFTSDMLVESVHFKRGEDLRRVGYKALAVSVSDIAAMGGLPRYALVSVGLPKQDVRARMRALADGIQACAKKFGVAVIGGDTNRSRHIVVDVFMVGEVERERLVCRSGARVGDVLFVSGALGGAQKGRHLFFKPRLKEARFLVEYLKPTSMIDLSDGLSQDLPRLARASCLGALIFEEQIPRACGVRDTRAALCDGEDFELLFTLSERKARLLPNVLRRRKLRFQFTPIGRMTGSSEGVRMMTIDGRRHPLGGSGFRHF